MQRIAYSAFCCASERLYVSTCRTDFSGGEKSPSELIGQIKRILPECKMLDASDFDDVDMIQSEASAFEVAAKNWKTDNVLSSTLKACFADMPEYTSRIMALERAGASKGRGSLRYSNSLEPLRELETVRIKLVKDFIDEPMLAAKFPHPLYCILGSVLINIVGM